MGYRKGNKFRPNRRERQRLEGPERREFRERRPENDMYDAVCDKCGQDCRVPFRPSGDKPIYCSDCFSKKPRDNFESRDSPKKHSSNDLQEINRKLDKIMRALKIN